MKISQQQKPENKWKCEQVKINDSENIAMKTHYDCDKQKPDQTNEVNLWEKTQLTGQIDTCRDTVEFNS